MINEWCKDIVTYLCTVRGRNYLQISNSSGPITMVYEKTSLLIGYVEICDQFMDANVVLIIVLWS